MPVKKGLGRTFTLKEPVSPTRNMLKGAKPRGARQMAAYRGSVIRSGPRSIIRRLARIASTSSLPAGGSGKMKFDKAAGNCTRASISGFCPRIGPDCSPAMQVYPAALVLGPTQVLVNRYPADIVGQHLHRYTGMVPGT